MLRSRSGACSQGPCCEVLEFGSYHGEQFVPKSLLRSKDGGTLEVVGTTRCCPPRRPTHFAPSFLDLNDIL